MSLDNEVSYIDNEVSYMDTQSMMFDGPETRQTPPASLSCSPPASSPPRCHSPRSPSYSPPASFPSRESSAQAQLRGLLTWRQEETPVWTSFHLTLRHVNQGLTCGLSALLAEMSPLAPYRLQQQAKAKAQEKITTHKWLLSRPFGSFQDHLVYT